MNALAKETFHFQELLQTIQHTRKIANGVYLFQEGTLANELFIIKKGKIEVNKILPDGRELAIRLCSPGDLIGEFSLFSDNGYHMTHAKVIESGEVAVISKADLEMILSHDYRIAMEYMKWITKEHRKTQMKFRDLVVHGKKGALYSTLIRFSNTLGKKDGNNIVIDKTLTNQELANYCGSSREVINRLLSDLRKRKVISIDKGIITIHDISYLRKKIDCENCPLEICTID